MNQREFKDNWREYALIGIENGDFEMLALIDVFEGCEEFSKGLIFISRAGIRYCWELKCDENGDCYRRNQNDLWEKIGRLVLVNKIRKDPKISERLKMCAELFLLRAGGY